MCTLGKSFTEGLNIGCQKIDLILSENMFILRTNKKQKKEQKFNRYLPYETLYICEVGIIPI